MTTETPQNSSAALLVRADGQLLLVRHRSDDAPFAGLWSLPMEAVGEEEVAEETLERVLRDRLHVGSGASEFAETLSVAGAGGARYIVNVFTCTGWGGEPRFSDRQYEDAGWVHPARCRQLELVPELRSWLLRSFDSTAPAADPAALTAALEEARDALLAAYDAVPEHGREQRLLGERSPLDLLAQAASAEAYYAAESRRLLESPGHSWRPFNEAQWEDDRRMRPPEAEAEVRARLDRVREATLSWLRPLTDEQLAAYGNHPQRGAVTVGDRIGKIARCDREHVTRLEQMLGATQVRPGPDGGAIGEQDVAADR